MASVYGIAYTLALVAAQPLGTAFDPNGEWTAAAAARFRYVITRQERGADHSSSTHARPEAMRAFNPRSRDIARSSNPVYAGPSWPKVQRRPRLLGHRRFASDSQDMASSNGSAAAPVWEEWGRITRFLESARLAFARERNLWASLQIESAEDVKLSAPTGQGAYRVSLHKHLSAIQDEDTLYASVLVHNYALVETAAADRLCANARDFGGIEDWGARLLTTTGETWDSVKEGVGGAVEVAVVRNAYAHGTRRIDQSAENRLRAVGKAQPSAGDPVTMDYAALKIFRARLRSLLHAGGFGRAN